MEYQIYCEPFFKSFSAASVQYTGLLVGNFIGGCSADRYGRRLVLLEAVLLRIPELFLCGIIKNLIAFYALRFSVGLRNLLGGFMCNNGFCCPQCPANVMPFGACMNAVCGGGRTCQADPIDFNGEYEEFRSTIDVTDSDDMKVRVFIRWILNKLVADRNDLRRIPPTFRSILKSFVLHIADLPVGSEYSVKFDESLSSVVKESRRSYRREALQDQSDQSPE
ncbi:hypothetical protein Aduo_008942 [Ancylostoma duodenale]